MLEEKSEVYADKVQAVARHELGHFVACRHLGFETGWITVQVDGEGPGHRGSAAVVLHTPIHSFPVLDAYLFGRCVILHAGALAEALTPGTSSGEMHEEDVDRAMQILEDPNSGAFADSSIARELQALLRNVRYPETPVSDRAAINRQIQAIRVAVWEKATAIIGQNAEAICSIAAIVAGRLTQKGKAISMSAAELEAIPEIASILAG